MPGDINLNTAAPCPSCGHCPTCGRGGYRMIPYWPYPYYSQPYWSIITMTGTGPTYGNASSLTANEAIRIEGNSFS